MQSPTHTAKGLSRQESSLRSLPSAQLTLLGRVQDAEQGPSPSRRPSYFGPIKRVFKRPSAIYQVGAAASVGLFVGHPGVQVYGLKLVACGVAAASSKPACQPGAMGSCHLFQTSAMQSDGATSCDSCKQICSMTQMIANI